MLPFLCFFACFLLRKQTLFFVREKSPRLCVFWDSIKCPWMKQRQLSTTGVQKAAFCGFFCQFCDMCVFIGFSKSQFEGMWCEIRVRRGDEYSENALCSSEKWYLLRKKMNFFCKTFVKKQIFVLTSVLVYDIINQVVFSKSVKFCGNTFENLRIL